jgi:hypothetical protein
LPAEEFLALVDESDAELAERFGLPIEQSPCGGSSSARVRTGSALPLIDG